MSDTMRDAVAKVCEGWTLPADARKILESALWATPAAQSQPAPPATADVQEIMRLIQPYVAACLKFNYTPVELIEKAEADVNAEFKPFEAALTALVDERDRLKFELAGVNAMRRPEWVSVDERLPADRVTVLAWDGKHIGMATHYHDVWGSVTLMQSVTHWQPLPPPPTHGIEPEHGGNHG